MTRLGETIKKARLGAKMTEKALAKKCGVAESFIKEVEAGPPHRFRRPGPAHPEGAGREEPRVRGIGSGE